MVSEVAFGNNKKTKKQGKGEAKVWQYFT